jgi:hypothetical protein
MMKEEIYICKGCAFSGKGSRTCSDVNDETKIHFYGKGSRTCSDVNDETRIHCGTKSFIYIQDTPEAITNYLELKLNEEEEREDD